MSATIESEAPPRASTDTVIEEPPSKPEVDIEMAQQGVHTRGGEVQREATELPPAEALSPRVGGPPTQRVEWEHIRNQPGMGSEEGRVEWEHIRNQLGMSLEERRVEWEQIRDQLGLSDDDEESVSLLKQIAQACLVLATTPFMLLHGVFKMTGALLRSLGMIFTGLGMLAGKLTYKPKKYKNKRAMRAGMSPG